MVAALLAIVAGLIAALPQILTMIENGKAARHATQHAIIDRDESVLSAGLDKLRKL